MTRVVCHRIVIFTALAAGFMRMAGAQGFGRTKDTVALHRKLPAVFHLEHPAVAVKVTGIAANSKPLVDQLGPLLEAALQESDKRINIENARPETIVSCAITSAVAPKIQILSRNTTSVGKNAFGKKGMQTTAQQYEKVTGQITIAYKATDAKTRKTLDASIVDVKINEDYEANGSKTKSIAEEVNPTKLLSAFHKKHEAEEAIPATPDDVNQLMIRRAVQKIAMRIVTTDDTVDVLLPRGALDASSKLGESGLWPRMLEAVSTVPAFARKEDEAYRAYSLGVAYEAMGYDAPDSRQAMLLFQKAAIEYGKAIDDKPDEKYFRAPQQRIEQALVIEKTLADRGGSSKQPAQIAPFASTATDSPAPDVLTNDQIIELAKSGLNEENLIANIKDAEKVQFDLSINGQKQLLSGGVSNNVLSAMRARMRGPVATPIHRVAPAAAPAAKKTP